MEYYNTLDIRLPLRSMQKLQLVQNYITLAILGASRMTHGSPLQQELHCMLLCFRVQFKMLVIAFKILQWFGIRLCKEPSYIRHMLWTLSVKEFWQERSKEEIFLCFIPILWNSLPPDMKLALALLAIQKSVKIWFCQLAWSLKRSMQSEVSTLKVLPAPFNSKLILLYLLGSHFTEHDMHCVFIYAFIRKLPQSFWEWKERYLNLIDK